MLINLTLENSMTHTRMKRFCNELWYIYVLNGETVKLIELDFLYLNHLPKHYNWCAWWINSPLSEAHWTSINAFSARILVMCTRFPGFCASSSVKGLERKISVYGFRDGFTSTFHIKANIYFFTLSTKSQNSIYPPSLLPPADSFTPLQPTNKSFYIFIFLPFMHFLYTESVEHCKHENIIFSFAVTFTLVFRYKI